MILCLRTLNYERAIVLNKTAATHNIMSQNPQLREGYCTITKIKKQYILSQNPQLREGYCTKHSNGRLSLPCLRTLNYERAIVQQLNYEDENYRLRTLNYERAIVLAKNSINMKLCLRTLNYERAIVLKTINNPTLVRSQNPQLREGYCTLIYKEVKRCLSQNPQLREGYCTRLPILNMHLTSQNPQLREGYCTKNIII